jgi:alcohol dehydrogenase (cytochrome c)
MKVVVLASMTILLSVFTPVTVAQMGGDGAWTTYSGSFASHRFSPLPQISPANVARLRPAWVYQPPGTGSMETTPLVTNGVMYLTWGPTAVAALDVKSGKSLWEWTRPIAPSVLNLGFPRVNRGVAILDTTLYVGTLDGYLVALDARSGAERWSVHVGDNPSGHAITAAPLAVDGRIIVGVSGGEAGIRGFLDAYDAKTGKQLWRFWTIPSPGEPGSNTWPGDSWVHGGGATWLTGSYDPQLKLLYWGTGNAGPDWNGDSRLGDNLYTSSLVAIDIETGKPRWHFQFTPHDVHDWDANQIPVLVDTEVGGRARPVVVTANRNGFFYALDRKTGNTCWGRPTRSRPGQRASIHRAVPFWSLGWNPPKEGPSCIPASKARRTGRARPTARRPASFTYRFEKWGRFTTRRRSSTGRGRTTPAAPRSGWTRNPGARCARST